MNSLKKMNDRRMRRLVGMGMAVAALLGTVERVYATWSIIIIDTQSREIAVGSATCVPDIDLKRFLPVVIVDVGAAAAQSVVDSTGENRMLIHQELLSGTDPADIIPLLAAQDTLHQSRQYGIADVLGRTTTFTGTSTSAYADGLTGQTGTLVYAIQGNILTGAPVLAEAEQALLTTAGDVPAKLMAAMQAARAAGGDGRCSCEREGGSSPTDCGSPPSSFTKSADVGFMVVSRTGDARGVCDSVVGCANGEYFIDLNVRFQSEGNSDPVFQLQNLFDSLRTDLIGRADAVQSTSSVDPVSIPDDGTGSATLSFTLRDWQGTAVVDESLEVTVTHAADSAAATIIGSVVSDGGGAYHVDLTGTTRGGRDHFRVAVHHPERRVILIPRPTLLSVCTGGASCDDGQFCNGTESCDLGTGECLPGVAPCAEDEVCNETDDTCDPISCQIAAPPVAELIASGMTFVPNVKNRVLSILAGEPGRQQAIKVTFGKLPPPFDVWNGNEYWVGQPQRICERAGQGAAPSPEIPPNFGCQVANGLARNWTWYAPLVCDFNAAHFMDWHGQCLADTCMGGLNAGSGCVTDDDCQDVVHLYQEGVLPTVRNQDAVYEVRTVDGTCDASIAGNYSTPLVVTQPRLGDLVGIGAQCQFPPAQGAVGLEDINGLLGKFANAACQITKTRGDVRGALNGRADFVVGLPDINALLVGFSNPTAMPWGPVNPADPCHLGLGTAAGP